MACCGKKIKHIAQGYTSLAIEKTTGKEVFKYEFADDRIRECHKCDEQTWLSEAEYAAWLLKNSKKILRNFDDLSILPQLPKQEQSKSRNRLYCRICKCFIPAAARVPDKECSLGIWRLQGL